MGLFIQTYWHLFTHSFIFSIGIPFVEMKQCKIKKKLYYYIGLFKDAMPVSFRLILFTSYILTIFKQRNLLS